jgi:glycosyltransferase involved in cell wall biosynthesis
MRNACTRTRPILRLVTTNAMGKEGMHAVEGGTRRRVLMIAQAFPPTGGPGVQRSAKFAKYLPACGWEPVVWSADHVDQLPYDESLLADLPADLHRFTRPAWSDTAAHRQLTRLLGTLGGRRLLGTAAWQGLDWRLLRLLRRLSVGMVPDDQWPWVLRSAVPLLGLVRREAIDAVYSTYSPVANHLLGWLVQRVTGLPWVADFRDLWTDDYAYARRSPWRRRIESRLERALLRRANAVVAVTPSQTRILGRHVPEQPEKFVCITNGVDTDDFAGIDPRQARRALHGPAERFVLTFAGWFLSDRVDAGLVDGLGRFARWARAQSGSFEFRVVGAISEDMSRRFVDAGVPLTATGYLPHDEAIGQMLAADVLLLPAPAGANAETLMPGKAFEYLAAGRPILLVGPPDGEVQRLVRDCDAGVCVESQCEAVCAALTDLWRQWRSGHPRPGCAPDRLQPFTREHLAGRLAEVLDHTCRAGGTVRHPT